MWNLIHKMGCEVDQPKPKDPLLIASKYEDYPTSSLPFHSDISAWLWTFELNSVPEVAAKLGFRIPLAKLIIIVEPPHEVDCSS